MPRRNLWLLVVLLSIPWPAVPAADEVAPRIRLSEVVADPQNDWNADGRVTASDEYVEFENLGASPADLTGWRLLLNDTTPTTRTLEGTLAPGERRGFVNPPGEINNNGHVALLDPTGVVHDEVRFGNWPGNAAGNPSADANGALTEALRWTADGWSLGHATPGGPNGEPRIDHAPPFDALEGWWDPGNATRSFDALVTDADRTYQSVRADLDGLDGSGTASHALAPSGAPGRWNGSVRTPFTDFEYEFLAVDGTGGIHRSPPIRVRVDATPPPVPRLEVPAWTNRSSLDVRVGTVEDAGVGGVEYRVEAAADPDGPWTTLGPWSPNPGAGPINLTESAPLWLRAAARDAYHHESAASTPRPVRLDATPPSPLQLVNASGYPGVLLEWVLPQDDASGVQEVRVERVAPSRAAWNLGPNATQLFDAEFRPGDEPFYRFWTVDRAGNTGSAILVHPDFEGLYPHAKPLRVSRSWWGPGTLTVHADFDRPMDEVSPPLVVLRVGDDDRLVTGAWLSNHTTYAVRLPDSQAFEAGEATFFLRDARDRAGRSLWSPQTGEVHIDQKAPSTRLEPEGSRWVNASGIRLTAEDDADASPRIRYRAWSDDSTPPPEASYADATLELRPDGDTLRVRYAAEDRAGNREGEKERTFRVDREAPRLGETRWSSPGRLQFAPADDGAGIDANATRISCDDGELPWKQGRRLGEILVDVDCPVLHVRIELADLVGNVYTSTIPIPTRAVPVDAGEDVGERVGTATQNDGAGAAQERRLEPAPLGREAASSPAFLVAAALVLAAGLAGFARRRRVVARPTPSLARRVLAARAVCP